LSLTSHARKSPAKQSNFLIREYEAEFKKAVARESGAQGGSFDEKDVGRIFRDTVPSIAPPSPYFCLTNPALFYFYFYTLVPFHDCKKVRRYIMNNNYNLCCLSFGMFV
jgi:hypothetical protein